MPKSLLEWIGFVFLTVFGATCLCGVVDFVKFTVDDEQKRQLEFQRAEPQDRADFENFFEVPAELPLDAPVEAWKIKHAKVRTKLIALAKVLTEKEEKINQLGKVDIGSSFDTQVAILATLKKEYATMVVDFIRKNHLANRFDWTPLQDYHGISGPHGTELGWGWQTIIAVLERDEHKWF